MNRTLYRNLYPVLLVAATSLWGCGSGYNLDNGGRLATSINIIPGTAIRQVGQTQQFSAVALFTDGTSEDVTGLMQWSSSNPSVVSVGLNTGLANSLLPGTVSIVAQGLGFASTAGMTVSAVTAPANRIYVSNFSNSNNHSVSVFDINASGNVAPLRSIQGLNTGLASPRQLAVSGNELFVADGFAGLAVRVYDLAATGNVAPLRSLSGANTGFSDPDGLAIVGNELFVSDQNTNSIKAFSVNASGNQVPTRTITSAQLQGPFLLGNNASELLAACFGVGRVVGFPSAGSGNIALIRNLQGATAAVDQAHHALVNGNEILVSCGSNANNSSIRVFDLNADGDAAPLRVISGANTGLNDPSQLGVANGEIYVTNILANSITVYPLNASGNVAPTRTLQGVNTGLDRPIGLSLVAAP